MKTEQEFYICPTCFHVSEAHPERHEHEMIHYPGYLAGDQQLKSPVDKDGNLKIRAPRWFSTRKLPPSSMNMKGDRQTRSVSIRGEMVGLV
jgi:hypothetical protein